MTLCRTVMRNVSDQIHSANEERKRRLERRIDAIREDFALRNSKLRQAWSLTGEALSPKKSPTV